MNTLRQFAHSVKNSFYNPAFYRRIKNRRLSKSVLLLYGICCLTAFVWIVRAGVVAVPLTGMLASGELVEKHYPEGLVLTAQDNTFSSNVEEPYVIPMPEGERKDFGQVKNAVVVSTAKDLTVSEIKALDSVAVIMKSGVALQRTSDGRMDILTLADSKLGNFVVNEENAKTWSAEVAHLIRVWFVPLALLAGLFAAAVMLAVHLFVLLFGALVVKAVAAFKRVPMTYPQAYSTAVYAVVPILLLNFVLQLFFIGRFSLLNVLLFVIIVSVNLPKRHAPAAVEPHTDSESADA